MRPAERQLALQQKTVRVSCIVPVYNEEAVVAAFVQKLQQQLQALTQHFEIILVDDGSQDKTIQVVRQLPPSCRIRLLGLSRNFGKEIALTAGLEHCNGEVAIILDADFQHPIEVLPVFLQQWAEGYDMVYGVRQSRESEARLKRYFARMFYWIMRKITSIDLPSHAGDFRLLDKQVVDALKQFPERTRFMKGLYAFVGYQSVSVPFDVQERAAGKSSWGFMKLTELAMTGIASFSDVPLRVWGWIGFAISFIAFIYAIYIVTVTLLFGADMPGFPTLVVAIMFLGGIQLLSIGILGEYIARIFTEVKQRPKYLLQIKEGFDA
ncbi:MAG: glycosyl transferase family 2 [Gammaproteobacteria bacterium RIFCSPHIGHO2_12_FULL_45_12]|nr:MAG: glycosyl transferase family 2 [Gammaproteobacteria bacterium RIFCSPHIGHO2_12_FULL_45_12]